MQFNKLTNAIFALAATSHGVSLTESIHPDIIAVQQFAHLVADIVLYSGLDDERHISLDLDDATLSEELTYFLKYNLDSDERDLKHQVFTQFCEDYAHYWESCPE